jgi:hypothetical protein
VLQSDVTIVKTLPKNLFMHLDNDLRSNII